MTIGEIISLVQPIEIALILLGTIYILVYWSNVSKRFNEVATPKRAIIIFITSLLLIAIAKTALQYYVWASDSIMKHVLPPEQSWRFFAIYTGGRFWLGMLLGVISAIFLYVVMRTYVRMRKVEIANDHLLIGCMGALLVSWPRFVLFVPIALSLAVLFTILNLIVFKKNSVPLLPAFVIGAIISLIYGTGILHAIGLSVLTV